MDVFHATFEFARDRRKQLLAAPDEVEQNLVQGARRAREMAAPVLSRVRRAAEFLRQASEFAKVRVTEAAASFAKGAGLCGWFDQNQRAIVLLPSSEPLALKQIDSCVDSLCRPPRRIAMSKDMFPHASAEIESTRKHLGPDIHDAFTNFSQRVFAGGAYVRSTIALDTFDERAQKRETP